jgi:hypothetical protein
MLAVKEKQTEQVTASYRVSRDKRDWDHAKDLWNKQDNFGSAAVTMLAWTRGDKREVFRIKLHYAAGEINFREAMNRLRTVEGV